MDAKKERDLLLHLNAPEQDLVDGGLVVSGFVEHEAHVGEQLGILLQQLFASMNAAQLFVGDAEVDDVAAERNVAALQIEHGHQLGDGQRLHVQRAARPDVAPRSKAAEGRLGPLLRRGRNDIDVIEQKERLLIRAGTEARVNRLACWIRSNQLRLDAALDQELLKKASARG